MKKKSAKATVEQLSEEMRALGIRHEQAMKRIDAALEAITTFHEEAKRGLNEQEKTLLHRLDVVETAMKENMAFRLDVAALRYDVQRRREQLDHLEDRMLDLEARAVLSFKEQLEADR